MARLDRPFMRGSVYYSIHFERATYVGFSELEWYSILEHFY